uniref:Cardiotrophin-like cytokine factor 1 n=1 Tax=Erpetoichthys calabaricus TaxID=27687 RepID=A0A8C4SDB6_ERPCA
MSLCLFLFFSLFILSGHYGPLAVLLATLLHTLRVSAFNVTDASSATAIQRTYELTKYLEHQLSTLTVSYLTYLGPPFNDPDFTPPRPNNSASLPSAATRLDLWKGLDNRLRLSENHRAYSILLGALKGLAAGTLCPSLQRSLQHFCTGLHGLLVSIAGVMTSLGYPPPLPSGEDIPNYFTPKPGSFDFSRKMGGFWVLKELQTWLWRSAKDFNRLKKKLPIPRRRTHMFIACPGIPFHW